MIEIARAHRVVVKVGSSSLTTPAGGIDPARIEHLVDALAAVRLAGREVVLVSSGAIAAGLAPLGLRSRAAGPGHPAGGRLGRPGPADGALHPALRRARPRGRAGAADRRRRTRRSHYRNAYRTFGRLLELGVVPIVNENDTVATHEIRFGDNDRLAALVAHLVHADALILLSDVDSLYTGNPSRPGCGRVSDVFGEADLAGVDVASRGSAVGTGGMVTKIDAARIATSAAIPVVLTAADQRCAARSPASPSAPASTPPGSDGRPGCCGWRTPATPGASSCSTRAPSGRWCSARHRCCRRASPASVVPSRPASR